ncbi:hypothetical protein DY000_02033603, partial [Brassica cretica]
MIEKIVNDVSSKLGSRESNESNDFDDFVGIEAHMKNMNSLLELESEREVMVGIWGPSGVGKTTIGRTLFSQLSCQFQRSFFIDKTKEIYTRANSYDHYTKLDLQAQFLSEILDQKDIKVHSLQTMRYRLRQKKVLVVFDDMDDQVLLDAVLGKPRWVGPRSRIVVISKNRELLRARGIESDRIYEVDYPSEELASQMFCRCTFGQDCPPDGFMELAKYAVDFTGNVPLALNVLGSSLAGLKKEEWEKRMPMLVLKSLKKMDLRRSKNLKVFPDLEELCLEDCCSLVRIPSSIRNLKKLRELDMKRCEKLRGLPTNIDLESLHSLNFSGCSKLRSFPRISRNMSHLFLDDTDIKKVPGWIENISPNISKLKVLFFSDFDSFAEECGLAMPTSAKSEILGVPVLKSSYSLDSEMDDISLSGGSSRNWKNEEECDLGDEMPTSDFNSFAEECGL